MRKKKKQIHIVNRYFYPVVAGIETCLLETYTRFNHNEWDITVHTSADTLTHTDVLPENDKVMGIKVVRYHTYNGIFIPNIPWSKADAVLLNNFSIFPIFPLLVYAYFLKFVSHKRTSVFLIPHGGFTPIWESFITWKRVIKRAVHYVGRFLINNTVDAVHSVAEWEKEQMIALGINPEIIVVIPNGVEEVAFSRQAHISPEIKKLAQKAGKYIITLSRVDPVKNLEVAIKALQHIDKSYNLLILGKLEYPDYYKKLNKLVKNLKLESRVIFANQITGADKYYLLRNAVLMVHPSKYEVDPIAIKEGLSQELICIGAENTGTARLIVDGVNGFLVPTNDHIALAEKIMYVVKNRNSPIMKTIEKNNIALRDSYHWSRVSAKVEQLINSHRPIWSYTYSSSS